jgi:hypothetical protein
MFKYLAIRNPTNLEIYVDKGDPLMLYYHYRARQGKQGKQHQPTQALNQHLYNTG